MRRPEKSGSNLEPGHGGARSLQPPGQLASARDLLADWKRLCSPYLPIIPENSNYRFSRVISSREPEQGWKIHVSATILSASTVFSRVAPLLSSLDVLFKAARTLDELRKINGGLHYRTSQIGKFITVYPRDVEEARLLVRELHRLTYGLPCPRVPFDVQFRPESCVYYRYGSFHSLEVEQPDGTRVPAIRDPEGNLIPDRRGPNAAIPTWLSDFIDDDEHGRRDERGAASPLRATFRIFDAVSQRGKGGVYNAVDFGVIRPRLCIVKEGRRQGETDWDGRDGRWRVRHEGRVLASLYKAGAGVPEVYATFEVEGHAYLAMEYIKGKTLSKIAARGRRRMPLRAVLDYGFQAADLLRKIHGAGWVWLDCKPSNLIVSEDGILRPVDFESACRIDEPDQTPWVTSGFSLCGTDYGPAGGAGVPEDLRALGMTLHFMLTGRTPDDAPPPLVQTLRRGVPPAIRRTIAALLDPDRLSRPSAALVSEVLASARAEAAGATGRRAANTRARRRKGNAGIGAAPRGHGP